MSDIERDRRSTPPSGDGPPAAGDAAADGSHPSAVSPYRWIILVGLISAVIMEALDTTIINVALPQMGGNLGATPNEIGWVSTGYILSVVIVLPLTAWLAARFGRKRYLVTSILLFIFASFFCGTSRSLGELVFWRVLQGMGGGALLSTAQATLLEIFPAEQQGMVQSIFGLGVVVAPAVAPMLGGWLTDNYSWPWVFFVNLPIGLVSAFLVTTYLQDSRYENASAGAVDWAGIGLLAVGLGSLQYVLQEGQLNDWFGSPLITRLAVLSVAALVAFVVWELWPANTRPAVNLRVLGDRNLLGGSLLGGAMGFGLVGGLFIFPLFVQGILGFTATETGVILVSGRHRHPGRHRHLRRAHSEGLRPAHFDRRRHRHLYARQLGPGPPQPAERRPQYADGPGAARAWASASCSSPCRCRRTRRSRARRSRRGRPCGTCRCNWAAAWASRP